VRFIVTVSGRIFIDKLMSLPFRYELLALV